MGLSASMWTSVSGLLAHGNKMNVVGNNIANVSTIGFKGQRMDFNDYLYINGGSTSGPTQIGAGVSTYAVIGDFSQGSLESTNSVTDLAIDGNGFFKVRKPNSDDMYYTRAGGFYFNADRQLQNPEGYRLQGWKIDNSTRLTFKSDSVNLGENTANETAFQGTGTPQDIILDSWYLEPQRTSSVNFTMGLTSDNNSDRSTSTKSPMTALFDQWDATKKPPMPDSSYATSSSIKVYDEGGSPHTLSVYYDQVATQAKDAEGNVLYSIDGLPAGYTMYEYVVTIPPEEDMRSFGGTKFNEATNEFDGAQPTKFYNDPVAGTNKNAGMLMTGHLIFDAAGNLVNQTAYSYGATTDIPNNEQCSLDPAQLSSWQATKFSSNGLPVFCANFTGQPLANSVNEKISATQSQAQDYLIELDFGLRTAGDWSYAGSLDDLVGGLEAPANNTTTRVQLATVTQYHVVEFTEKTADNPASWDPTGEDADGEEIPDVMQDPISVRDNPSIFLSLPDGTRTQIDYGKNGPSVIFVDPDSGKTKTFKEMQDLQKEIDNTADPDEKEALQGEYDSYKAAFMGIDGKPIYDKDKNIVEAEFDENTGYYNGITDTFLMERNLKKVPENAWEGDYQQVQNGEMVDIEFENEVYARTDGGKKVKVHFDEEGLIIGVSDDLGATAPERAYNGETLYIDKAVAARTIDYNKAVSTFDDPLRGDNATTAGNKSFITQDAGQNGYASGILSSTNITNDGVVYGYYDNGQTIPLYQIALYDFHNHQGLRREGGNLYAQTKESGEARQGVAGEAGFGVTRAYNIEMSNVDLSREFVNMITTQRGFQANSKGVTTVDTMLETVIGMKR